MLRRIWRHSSSNNNNSVVFEATVVCCAALLRADTRHSASTAAAAATSSSAGSPGSQQQQQPAILFTQLGLTDTTYRSLFIAFEEKNRQRSDWFIPPISIMRQCKYTASLYQQLQQQFKLGRAERWLPQSCVVQQPSQVPTSAASRAANSGSNAPSGAGVVSTSRLIIATAFDDRKSARAGHGGLSSGPSPASSSSSQARHTEQLQHTRRLAVEHFNWSYYWRSLHLERSGETEASRAAAAAFASLAAPHASSFFFPGNKANSGEKKNNSTAPSSLPNEESVIPAVKQTLREFALHGGAATLGGSWTWLVWNPISHGTDFSTRNRFGLASGGLSSVPAESAISKQSDGDAATATSAAASPTPATAAAAAATSASALRAPSTDPKRIGQAVEQSSVKPEATAEQQQEEEAAAKPRFQIKIGGRIEVINTPFDVCPLDYGLFPLLCINMTERAFLATPSEWATVPVGETPFAAQTGSDSASASAPSSPPSWSRAARNASSIVTRTSTLCTPGYQAFETIEQQRERFVDGILNSNALNWSFAASQLDAALQWNESERRRAKMEQNAAAVWGSAEEKVKRALERKISADGGEEAELLSSLSAAAAAVEQEASAATPSDVATSSASDASGTSAASAVSAASSQDVANSAADNTEVDKDMAANTTTAATTTTTSNSSTTGVSDIIRTYNEEDRCETLQFPDGRVEYLFDDGRKTIMYPNGTTEWHSAPSSLLSSSSSSDNNDEDALLLQREFATGKREYIYKSGAVVEEIPQADGKSVLRKSKLPDGSVAEELVAVAVEP